MENKETNSDFFLWFCQIDFNAVDVMYTVTHEKINSIKVGRNHSNPQKKMSYESDFNPFWECNLRNFRESEFQNIHSTTSKEKKKKKSHWN